MRKIKRDDEVIVIAGRDKGKRGAVVRVISNEHLIVSGVNMVKKHQKPNPTNNQPGGIIEKESPVDISNLSLINSEGQNTRLGYRFEDGKKVRYAKKNNEII